MPHITQKYKDNLDAARNANHSLAVFIKVGTCSFCLLHPFSDDIFRGLFSLLVAVLHPDGQRVRVQTNQQLHELFYAWRPKGTVKHCEAVQHKEPAVVSLSPAFLLKSRHCLSSSLSSCVLSATTSTMSLWTCPCRLERGGSWDFKVRGSILAWWRLFTLLIEMDPNELHVKGCIFLLQFMLVKVIT